jgi:hypothetical protein
LIKALRSNEPKNDPAVIFAPPQSATQTYVRDPEHFP